jgi:hypothetical protein
MSTTLQQLEQKLNVKQIVRDNPWPALALAVGAGVLLSGSRAGPRTAEATVAVSRGATHKVGSVLDDVIAGVVGGLHAAFESRVASLVSDIRSSLRTPAGHRAAEGHGTAYYDRIDSNRTPVADAGVRAQATRAD